MPISRSGKKDVFLQVLRLFRYVRKVRCNDKTQIHSVVCIYQLICSEIASMQQRATGCLVYNYINYSLLMILKRHSKFFSEIFMQYSTKQKKNRKKKFINLPVFCQLSKLYKKGV